jgi:hypothetical protein
MEVLRTNTYRVDIIMMHFVEVGVDNSPVG